MRCQRFSAAARREEREYLYGSLNDEQRSSRAKGRATLRAEFWRVAGGVAPQSQSAAAMLFRRALPATRQNSAHPVPIYEMGSISTKVVLAPILPTTRPHTHAKGGRALAEIVG